MPPVAQQPNIVHRSIQTTFEGPLPPPDQLRQYDDLSPGAADRIIKMAEDEANHRREMERRQLDSDIESQKALIDTEGRRIDGIFKSDALGQKLGATISAISLLAAAGTAAAGLIFGIDSQWYWAIPVACVSLPVMGMVKAIRSRPEPTKVDSSTQNAVATHDDDRH